MSGGWQLEDAEKRAEKAPATFFIPPPEVRETLKKGWHAKLIFGGWDSRGRVAVERMWVEIREVAEGPQYAGALMSVPAILCGITKGDKIAFAAKHVCDYVDA